MPENKCSDMPETRSLAVDVGAVAVPVALVAQPFLSAWADSHIGQGGNQQSPPPPPPQQQQDDS